MLKKPLLTAPCLLSEYNKNERRKPSGEPRDSSPKKVFLALM